MENDNKTYFRTKTTGNASAQSRKKKTLQKKWHLRYIRIFTSLFAIMLVISLLIPIRPTRSDLEKRDLAKFPTPTVAGLLNGSWFEGVNTWFSDTFPFREQLLTAQSGIESLYGLKGEELYGAAGKGEEIPEAAETAPILLPSDDSAEDTAPETESSSVVPEAEQTEPAADAAPAEEAPAEAPAEETQTTDGTIHEQGEVAGTVYITDNRGFEVYYFTSSGAEYYASMLNTVHSILGDSVHMYDLLAPTSFGVCLDENIQASLGGSSEKDAFVYTYSMLDPSISQVSVFDDLLQHNSEYLYYNTDHHWTALGAYYAYRTFCSVKGITPHELSEYQEQQYPDFLGTFYSYSNQSDALANNPDTVYAYVPIGTNDTIITDEDGSSYAGSVIYDGSTFSTGSKYSCFIGGDHALTTITNPNITDGSSCVIVKESYGNAFVPFLVDHYQNVYVVDYRYYADNLTTFIQQNNVQDLIFLNNSEAILQSNAESMLNLFG